MGGTKSCHDGATHLNYTLSMMGCWHISSTMSSSLSWSMETLTHKDHGPNLVAYYSGSYHQSDGFVFRRLCSTAFLTVLSKQASVLRYTSSRVLNIKMSLCKHQYNLSQVKGITNHSCRQFGPLTMHSYHKCSAILHFSAEVDDRELEIYVQCRG